MRRSLAARLASADWRRLVVRRILAFTIDYVVVGAYLLLLAAASVGALRVTGGSAGSLFGGRASSQAVGFLLVTLPVALYFALQECSSRRATLGKRAMGLQIVRHCHGQVSFSRSLARTALKFLPWELAHTFVWQMRFTNGDSLLAMSGLAAVWVLVAIYLRSVLLSSNGRSLYDAIAGTQVIRVR